MINNILREATDLRLENRCLRWGQSVYIIASNNYKDIVNRIMEEFPECDCFNNSDKVEDFLNKLIELINESKVR